MKTFTLTIELGNDAMRTSTDVANALREISTKVELAGGWPDDTWDSHGGNIRDANGNTVGRWEVK